MTAEIHTGAGDRTTHVLPAIDDAIPLEAPANTVVGDLLAAFVTFQNGDSVATAAPDGWVAIGLAPPAGYRPARAYLYPVVDATALADVTGADQVFTTTASPGRGGGQMFRITGADLSAPDAGNSAWSPSSGTSSTVIPSFTSSTADALVLVCAYMNASAGTTPPAGAITGFTESGHVTNSLGAGSPPASTGSWVFHRSADDTSQEAATITWSPSGANSAGFQVAIKAAPEPPTEVTTSVMRGIAGLPWVGTAALELAEAPVVSLQQGLTSTIPGATLVPPTHPAIRYRGATAFEYGPAPYTSYFGPRSRYPHDWNTPAAWGWSVLHNGRLLEIRFRYQGAVSRYRLYVDGKRVTDLPQATGAAADGTGYCLKLDFGIVAQRRITFEARSMPFAGLWVTPGENVTPGGFHTRVIALGDSLTQGSDVNTGGPLGTWFPRFCQMAGVDDPWNQAIGGSGYTVAGQGTTFINRLADVTSYNPGAVIVWGGYNDGTTSLAAPAGTLFSAIRSALPDVEVYVFGIWSPFAAPGPGAFARDAELRVAASTAGCPFVSLITGDVYDRNGAIAAGYEPFITSPDQTAAWIGDSVHPNDVGHRELADYLYRALSTVVEIPATLSVWDGSAEVPVGEIEFAP